MRMHTIMQHKIKRQNAAENPMMKFPVFFAWLSCQPKLESLKL